MVADAARMDQLGSSPRGRGTPCRRSASRAFRTVHPRAGGEHMVADAARMDQLGSSPRGRGTPEAALYQCEAARFIPARAGNTLPRVRGAALGTVHPRAGGEHLNGLTDQGYAPGSSPRGRGTPRGIGRAQRSRRFIPARAGNTTWRSLRPARSSVHPRAGGEHDLGISLAVEGNGSSPRGREHRAGRTRSRISSGSSPRGRGTPRARYEAQPARRFIPARAGNTRRRSSARCGSAVHPRAGGEHTA